jgi:hypothetical protein
MVFVIIFLAVFIFGQTSALDFEETYDEGSGCIVHHPPHNDEFSCGSLCDSDLFEAEVVRAVYLTGFYANFDCISNKTSIKVLFFEILLHDIDNVSVFFDFGYGL